VADSKIEHNFAEVNGIGAGDGTSSIPIQTLPNKKKTKKWKQANLDALEYIGLKQLRQNYKFSSYRKMSEGTFTYTAVGLEDMEMPWFDNEVKKLRSERGIPTYIKHFDFIGIIVNALKSLYSDFEDKFFIDSRDEYSTNEYIRQKTEMLHKYAQQVFIQEVNKMLVQRGIDPNKEDFESQEEQQAYQQTVQENVQALTPPEIEQFMSKNFKVLATEWAQHTIDEDNVRFRLPMMDEENFVDMLLSGRWFKHFHVGYDFYKIERWKVEEVFFSQDADAQFPQDGEFVGRITSMSPSNILNRFGHLMTTAQQEGIGNYWNQTNNWTEINGARVDTTNKPIEETAFGQPTVVPFHNYFDHQANVQLEDALGVPLGKTTMKNKNGEEITFDSWTPRMDEDEFGTGTFSSYLRDDIDVRRDTVRVTEAYWRSYKRLAVLIYENELGSLSVELTTDDLLPEFLADREIKKLRNISLQDLQTALKDDNLEEYRDTITYIYVPEAWRGIKIKGNGSTVKDDMYLDIRPLDYQIKGGDSNIYDIKLPVAGIIGTGITSKLIPYQQLHNICMNQITELLEKELGVFFAFDITGFPSEYQDETTEESIFRARDVIKDTGMLGLDLSRQNTAGNQPNIFQRHEVVYATQVQYRWQLAQQYKQEALSQLGITPQLLGQPNTYTTAEGVKQGLQASYVLINPLFDKMAEAKAKELELHVSVAQYCQSSGKDQSIMFRKGDGDLRFLDIIAEDGDLFPLRQLSILPITSSKDRKIVEQLKQLVINDNTLNKDFQSVVDILTAPAITQLKSIAQGIRKRTDAQTEQQRQFESEQLDKQLQNTNELEKTTREHEVLLEAMKIQGKLEVEEIQAYATTSARGQNTDAVYDRIAKATQEDANNQFRQNEIAIKTGELQRKENDSTNSLNIELQKLELKAQELRLKREALDTQKFVATVNKN